MHVLKIALVIIFVLLGVALSAIILMQEGKSQGLGAISGMAESYWSKNRGRSVEGALEKFTKFAAVLFFIVALALDVIW
ncbi:MAG: preprotein translocase subunit SecG [Oribacterium sp.]|nr:preprotein translocase subunit SecG [Oribacterium sp.]